MGRSSASLLALAARRLCGRCGLVACGGERATPSCCPGAPRSEINANLDQVEQLAAEGDCVGAAQRGRRRSASRSKSWPASTQELKEALREGAARLNEVVAGCEETQPKKKRCRRSKKPTNRNRRGSEGESRKRPRSRKNEDETDTSDRACRRRPKAKPKATKSRKKKPPPARKRRRHAIGRRRACRTGGRRRARRATTDGGGNPLRPLRDRASGSAPAGCRTSTRRPT